MPWVRFNADTFRGEIWEGPKRPEDECKSLFTQPNYRQTFSHICDIVIPEPYFNQEAPRLYKPHK